MILPDTHQTFLKTKNVLPVPDSICSAVQKIFYTAATVLSVALEMFRVIAKMRSPASTMSSVTKKLFSLTGKICWRSQKMPPMPIVTAAIPVPRESKANGDEAN
jgi:hypothetical protein